MRLRLNSLALTPPNPAGALSFSGAAAPATVGVPYSWGPSLLGGTGPYTVTVLTGSIPAWAALNASTGVVSGASPTLGTVNFTLRVTDSATVPAHVDLAVSIVTSPGLAITGTPGASATVGTAYAFTPGTTGGNGTKTFGLTAGTLPAGLAFNPATGAITGTPTGAEVQAGLVITATDADGRTASLAAFTITVAAAGGGAAKFFGSTSRTWGTGALVFGET